MQIKTRADSYYYRVHFSIGPSIWAENDFRLPELLHRFPHLRTMNLRTKNQVIKAIKKFKYRGLFCIFQYTELTDEAEEALFKQKMKKIYK